MKNRKIKKIEAGAITIIFLLQMGIMTISVSSEEIEDQWEILGELPDWWNEEIPPGDSSTTVVTPLPLIIKPRIGFFCWVLRLCDGEQHTWRFEGTALVKRLGNPYPEEVPFLLTLSWNTQPEYGDATTELVGVPKELGFFEWAWIDGDIHTDNGFQRGVHQYIDGGWTSLTLDLFTSESNQMSQTPDAPAEG
jgi:hypothetical protein